MEPPEHTGGGMTQASRALARAAKATLISNRCREERRLRRSPDFPHAPPRHPTPLDPRTTGVGTRKCFVLLFPH